MRGFGFLGRFLSGILGFVALGIVYIIAFICAIVFAALTYGGLPAMHPDHLRYRDRL